MPTCLHAFRAVRPCGLLCGAGQRKTRRSDRPFLLPFLSGADLKQQAQQMRRMLQQLQHDKEAAQGGCSLLLGSTTARLAVLGGSCCAGLVTGELAWRGGVVTGC